MPAKYMHACKAVDAAANHLMSCRLAQLHTPLPSVYTVHLRSFTIYFPPTIALGLRLFLREVLGGAAFWAVSGKEPYIRGIFRPVFRLDLG